MQVSSGTGWWAGTAGSWRRRCSNTGARSRAEPRGADDDLAALSEDFGVY
ncbi:hypothetical protein ACWDTG_13980 [Rhodococcus zopfii]|nr:hypothetical protein [Rhodococcus zopfii]